MGDGFGEMEWKNHVARAKLKRSFAGFHLDTLKSWLCKVENFRTHDPAKYLYRKIADYSGDRFSDDFIKLSYVTLVAWDMNTRGAKLSDYEVFKKSILANKNTIELLAHKTLVDGFYYDSIEILNELYHKLEIVADGKPIFVTFSKLMHFFLPDLVPPMDRKYTLNFFKKNTPNSIISDLPKSFDLYVAILFEYRYLATKEDLGVFINDGWSKNIPKICDNIVIGYGMPPQVRIPASK